jgi:RNA polymerase sigma factor (sigma-70 family)
MISDSQSLLAEYARSGSEPAIQELVARYVGLVHSAAVRLVDGDAHLAQDVTQTVFVDLARMAQKLSAGVMLGGWLHRHTCFVASKMMRGERRRKNRERQAAQMNAQDDHPDLTLITPVLDAAINQLPPQDRTAILLRFFEERDLRSVGAAIGSSEDGARKRVARALDKLRSALTRQGVTLSATTLATVLANHAVSAAPAGMAAGVAATALAGAAEVGSGAAASLLTLAHAKAVVVGAIAVGGVATSLVFQQQAANQLDEANARMQRQAIELAAFEKDNERLATLMAQATAAPTDSRFNELLRLRGEVGVLRRQANDLRGLEAENQRLKAREATAPEEPKTPLQFQEESVALSDDARDWMLAFIRYAMQHENRFPASFDAAAPFLPDELKEGKVDRVDQLEIVYHGSIDAVVDPPQTMVLRQTFPRQRPDGQWEKAYGFADGHSRRRAQDDPDFDAFESRFIVQPISP